MTASAAGVTSAARSGVPRESFARSLASGLVGGYDVEGPRVRLGLLWLVALIVSMVLGGWALGVLMALVAGAAGSQSAAAWRRVGRRPHQIVAGLTGLLMPLAAALGTATLGAVAVVAVVAALVGATTDRRRHSSVLADAGLTLRCGFVVGLACASLVIIHRLEIGAAVCLVLLMCAYDVGDFLVGTGREHAGRGSDRRHRRGARGHLRHRGLRLPAVRLGLGLGVRWHGGGHVPAGSGAGHGDAPHRRVAGARRCDGSTRCCWSARCGRGRSGDTSA